MGRHIFEARRRGIVYGRYVQDTLRQEIEQGNIEMSRERKPTFDPEYIRDISEQAYRLRLEQDCPGNVARMIERDEDNGEKLRNRAASYDPLTRAYLKVLGFEPTTLPSS